MSDNAIKDLVKDKIDEVTANLLKKNRSSMKEPEALVATLRDVGEIMFGKSGMAIDYIDHFLGKSGQEKSFPLADLLAANPTIEKRVIMESKRRALNVKTNTGSRMSLKEGKSYLSGLDPCITVFQKNYDDVQWWGALGTFQVRMSHPVYNQDRDVFSFILTGDDEYRWAPDEDRPSQTIHKIAQKLVDMNLARNFPVKGQSMMMSVRKVEALFTLGVTTNDRAGRGILGTGFTSDQITRSIYLQYIR